jgi:low affinity Fe/Cu permease
MDRFFAQIANRTAAFVGQPIAFILAASVIAIWALTGPPFGYSNTWQLVINTGTTIVTFLMVFVIQNSQNRDAAAIQAKLDELIRASQRARNAFIGIEHMTDRQLESIRAALEHEALARDEEARMSHEAVNRLIRRF